MDIARFLGCNEKHQGYMEGDRYVVTWAVGHLIGLKDAAEHDESYKRWSLDPLPFDFPLEHSLKILPDTKAQFEVIKKLIHRDDIAGIINAGDAGREGLLIQELIYYMSGNKKPVKLLWASSFTDEALRKAFSSLKDRKDFMGLLSEAQARSEGDWRLGINYSRALTITIGNNNRRLIYGRCQTVLLNQVVLRDLEIENFKPVPYYNIQANYQAGFNGILVDKDKKKIDLTEKSKADDVLSQLSQLPPPEVIVADTADKETLPPLLYNLAALQKAMGSKYSYTPDKTLSIAQALYEKHKILSYPRTDSRCISTDISNELSAHLNALYGIPEYKPYLQTLLKIFGGSKPKLSKRYVNDQKVTDHYALIPTDAKNMGAVYATLSQDEKNVFDAVAKSFIAMFFPPFKYKATTIIAKTGEYLFHSSGRITVDPGYKAIFTGDEDEAGEKTDEESNQSLPPLKVGDVLDVTEFTILSKMTKPPARFTDNSIIALMEKNNIGTSATRAEIIKKLQNDKEPYMVREKNKYISTALGREYVSLLPEELKDLALTQRFEDALTKINEGAMSKQQFLADLKEEQKQYIELFKSIGPKFPPRSAQGGSPGEQPAAGGKTLTCPICGSRVRITQKGFFCSKEGCGFALWPTMKFNSEELKITEAKATQLLTGKRRAVFRLKKKDGTSYDAYLKIKINEVNGKRYVNFENDGFPKRKSDKGGK